MTITDKLIKLMRASEPQWIIPSLEIYTDMALIQEIKQRGYIVKAKTVINAISTNTGTFPMERGTRKKQKEQ